MVYYYRSDLPQAKQNLIFTIRKVGLRVASSISELILGKSQIRAEILV